MDLKMESMTERNGTEEQACERDPELMAAEEGLRLGLERWHDACPCCFSEAYPGGVPEAIEKLAG